MKTSLFRYLTFSIFILLSVYIYPQQSFKLQYKFEKGKTYRFANTVVSNIVQQAMGQEVKIDVIADAVQKIVAEDQVEGNMVLVTSLDSIVVTTKMPGRDTTMNLESFKDKRTRIILQPNGKIVNKEAIDSLDEAAAQLQQLNNESLRFFDLPKEEVKSGSTWSADQVDTINVMGGDMITNSKTNYTFAGVEDKAGYKCVKITFEGTGTNEGKTKMMGMELFIEGTGKTSGTLYFAPAEGLLISAEVQSDNDMTMATTGEQKMIIPITQSSKITQNLIK